MADTKTAEQLRLARLAHRADTENRIGIAQEQANKVLRETGAQDAWVAELVCDVVTQRGQDSYEALLRLLWNLGVGNIVTGRLN